MNITGKRSNGILMHITSLPSPYGIGDFGKGAFDFLDSLKKAGVNYWQLLPLGPTGYGNSPYSARSTFAGNELLISPEKLYQNGLLQKEDLEHPYFRDDKVEFDKVIPWKTNILKKAANAFLKTKAKKSSYLLFKEEEKYWLEDYAIFMVLYEKYNDARWHTVWDRKEGFRDKETLERIKAEKKKEIEIWMALQFIFSEELNSLRSYANKLGIKLIGDIPIFMGADSADAWSHLDLLKTDKNGKFSAQAGVPPDNFSATGQLWGNPVYDWNKNKKENFMWWKERFKRLMRLTDVVRIDHFRAFDAYYEIPAKDKTAEKGKWKKTPGKLFFKEIKREIGEINIIAEDLGFMTEGVIKLRDENGFPGMKIAQFGFTRDFEGYFNTYDDFLPMNYTRNFVAYTGTHDNDTTRSWFDTLSNDDKHMVREYLSTDDKEVVWALIKAVMLSNADYAIFPMQDILELGNEARMNYPSVCDDKNWTWRMKDGAFDAYRIGRYSFLVRISGRNGLTSEENVIKKAKTIASI